MIVQTNLSIKQLRFYRRLIHININTQNIEELNHHKFFYVSFLLRKLFLTLCLLFFIIGSKFYVSIPIGQTSGEVSFKKKLSLLLFKLTSAKNTTVVHLQDGGRGWKKCKRVETKQSKFILMVFFFNPDLNLT